ncbi:hypothetical protein Trydic_g13714 [Trypoxylus dichotomus]
MKEKQLSAASWTWGRGDKTVTRGLTEMLSTRTAEVTVGVQTTKIRTTRGTTQGGVCSSLLWNPVVDKLLNRLTACVVRCIGYAEDIAARGKGKFEGIRLESLTRCATQWG